MNHDPRQAALAAFRATTHQCAHAGCRTLTTHQLCARHRAAPAPSGPWAIAAAFKQELERKRDEDRAADPANDEQAGSIPTLSGGNRMRQ